jgi:hypothetical protein
MADSVNRLLQAFPLSGGGIRYISSSLLFVYDSANPNPNSKWKVRMIDFAHATPQLEYPFPPGDTIDKDYLYGLTSLNTMFQEILKSKGEDVATPDGI